MSEKMCGIYCIENLIDGKKYIGQSVDIKHRFYGHRSDLNTNNHYNSHLQAAWNLYGKENFNFYILEECSFDSLDEKEKYYVKLFNTNTPEHGYNKNSGGKGTTQESIRKLSKVATKNVWTHERKKQLSEKMLGKNNPFYGKLHTEDSIKKMKQNKPSMFGKNNPMYGKHHSEEAKKRISKNRSGISFSEDYKAKLKGRVGEKNPRHRPVYCPELDRAFWGPTEVEQAGITKQSYISAVLSGRQKTAGKHPITGEPLHWVYAS